MVQANINPFKAVAGLNGSLAFILLNSVQCVLVLKCQDLMNVQR